ncbi:FxsA cytoplasmic membrane protein [hydrothermal vent metagenome]|uniref:FxsA cytoplasmic membrane protein n=1 Tax=hydrothermal vent metagenome TaxID=652676 RepID=A0A3B0WAS6_9ZZZZ
MPLLFIVIPLVELYFILVVGGAIGAFWTVILVIMTAIIGVNLLRIQGMSTLAKAQRNMAKGQIPAMEMMEGIALAVAGVLLITPGFITDSIGFLCLIPASRQAIIRYLMTKTTVHTGFNASSGGNQSDQFQQKPRPESDTRPPKVGQTIEGEYRRED